MIHWSSLVTQYMSEICQDVRNICLILLIRYISFQSILPNVNNVLYADADIMFVDDPASIWNHFYLMNSTHVAGLVPEDEIPSHGSYPAMVRVPFYGKYGKILLLSEFSTVHCPYYKLMNICVKIRINLIFVIVNLKKIS